MMTAEANRVEEAQALLERLERALSVSRPVRLLWTQARTGTASTRQTGAYLINMPTRSKRPWQSTLCHEYAHCLLFSAREAAPAPGERRRDQPHGPEFVRALAEIVRLIYGDLRAYPWPTEYWSVWRAALERGWTQEPWFRQQGEQAVRQLAPGTRVRFQGRFRVARGVFTRTVDLTGRLVRVRWSRAEVTAETVIDGRRYASRFHVPFAGLTPVEEGDDADVS
jgi:hypothetical protein